jgi:hypothetical protein
MLFFAHPLRDVLIDLRTQPYCQRNESDAHCQRPQNTGMQNPVEPDDTAVFHKPVVEADQRQSDKCRCQGKGEFRDKRNYVG